MEYKVISDHSLERFNERLNEMVGEGWVKDGNLVVTAYGTAGREVLYSQMFSRALVYNTMSMLDNMMLTVVSEVAGNGGS